nr:hypothetical protein [Tanacetum cinerariifolium]
MRPFGCPVIILNTIDPLGKFDEKADEGFLVGYSINCKAFRVFNSRTKIVQETLHINFIENQPNIVRSGPIWLFDIDTLNQSMNYQPVVAGNQPNHNAGIQENLDAGTVGKEVEYVQLYVVLPLWSTGLKDPQNIDAAATFDVKENEFEVYVSPSSSDKTKKHDEKTKREAKGKSPIDLSTGVRNLSDKFEDFSSNNTNRVNAASAPITAIGLNSTNNTNSFNAAGPSDNVVSLTFEIDGKSSFMDPSQYPDDRDMPALEDIVYSNDEEDVGAEADFSNLETKEPKRVHQALKDPSWIEAMQEELLQFKMQKVWVLVDLPKGKRAIGSKWVFRNNKDERGIVIRNKARLVAQGHTQEEGMDYEEFFAPVARIEAIWLFLAYASFMGFMVYQMDVKSAFRYGTIEEEVYVCQPLGLEDPNYPDKVYVDDIIFGSTNKELCKAFEKLMKDKFQMSSMGKLNFFLELQVKQKEDGIFISQDKYVDEILRKFGLIDGESASTSIDTKKPLLKDPDGEDVDVHIYRLMIGSLMYFTSSRLDIMFTVCACARFQVTLKPSHLHAVKRIFRYLKGKPHLGFWYPKDSPFNMVAYFNSNYAGASLDRKSTTGGCKFLGEGFDQIVDFVTAHTLQYALMVNPTVYVSCIKHFWTLISIKKSNDAVKLQALIDRKKIFAELARMEYEKLSTKLTFYKAFFSVRWKFLIHIIVQCMSAKRTVWNEFSSSMASAVICLATVMINAQVDGLSSHNTKYPSPALTQKVFANIRRIGKGFLGVETPLFDAMLVPQQVQADVAEVEEHEDEDNAVPAAATLLLPTPATTPPLPQQEPIPSPLQA